MNVRLSGTDGVYGWHMPMQYFFSQKTRCGFFGHPSKPLRLLTVPYEGINLYLLEMPEN